MKNHIRRLLFFSIFILFTGCSPYWYNPDKTIQEAVDDCRECDSHKDFFVFADCMKNKGYAEVDELSLPDNVQRFMIPRRSRLLGLPLSNPDLIRIAGN